MHTPKPNPANLCWLDMEMTGLNPEHDRIIEAAVVITDADLNILAQSESYAIHQSDELLNGMDAWNTSTHERTGLTQRGEEGAIQVRGDQGRFHVIRLPAFTGSPSGPVVLLIRAGRVLVGRDGAGRLAAQQDLVAAFRRDGGA